MQSLDFFPNSPAAANCCVAPVLTPSSRNDTLSCCASESPCPLLASANFARNLLFKNFSFQKLAILITTFFLMSVSVMAEARSGNIYWTPRNATLNGVETDHLLTFIFWFTTVVFFLVQTFFIYYLIKYRRRPGVKAHYSHGNNTLEIIWTTLPTLIFLGLAIYGNRVWYDIHRPAPDDALTVEITGYQFAWDFRYPGASGKLARSDVRNITSMNKFGVDMTDPLAKEDFSTTELVVPVGKPVHVLLRSRDVIHSFYVPEFRIYQDAVPGRTIGWVWFKTLRTGNFQLACSQLCGKGHYNMKAPIRVVSQEEYDKWYAVKIVKPNIFIELAAKN